MKPLLVVWKDVKHPSRSRSSFCERCKDEKHLCSCEIAEGSNTTNASVMMKNILPKLSPSRAKVSRFFPPASI
jgi:hypothetical protein